MKTHLSSFSSEKLFRRNIKIPYSFKFLTHFRVKSSQTHLTTEAAFLQARPQQPELRLLFCKKCETHTKKVNESFSRNFFQGTNEYFSFNAEIVSDSKEFPAPKLFYTVQIVFHKNTLRLVSPLQSLRKSASHANIFRLVQFGQYTRNQKALWWGLLIISKREKAT